MPKYNASHHSPPAPIAQVILHDPESGVSSSDVFLLIDTGADTTLLPRAAAEQIGLKPIPGVQFEMEGFDGTRSVAPVVQLDMIFLKKAFRGQYVLIDAEWGVLGRDVLNEFMITLDGPQQEWYQHKEVS